ncbi:hypothetical protein FA95DRAFT_1038514 [Auriscalpium vulgare]|uniref:Uncharacterized protein n=1 Tax=Auriscalpium vulgare TaxID=40419 RepID=A0ACB8RX50_9AGAM|nr:hypothetical protein FA95DRAFT_1038514 [Auriscalpium vulgare]
MPPSYKRYATQMHRCCFGYALWRPDPPRQHPPVAIGDVGYIRFGGFHRLFNIHLCEDDPHQSSSLPNNFERIPLDDSRIVESPLQRGSYRSKSIRATAAGVQMSTPVSSVNDEVSFSMSHERGAVLVLPHDARRIDCHTREKYKEYIGQHFGNWVAFAEGDGLGVSDVDLVLVDGCDLAPSWAVADFVDDKGEASLALSSSADRLSTFNVMWNHQQGAEFNWGPTAEGAPNPNTAADQCIFLRGYHMKRRSRIDDTDPLQSPARQIESITYWSRRSDRDSDGDSDDSSGFASDYEAEDPDETTLYAPFLDYILANSDCDLALVHDEDMYPYLSGDLDPEAIASQLAQSAPPIEFVHGASLASASLRGTGPSTAQFVSSVERLSPGEQVEPMDPNLSDPQTQLEAPECGEDSR